MLRTQSLQLTLNEAVLLGSTVSSTQGLREPQVAIIRILSQSAGWTGLLI